MGEKIPMEGVNISPKMARVSVLASGADLTAGFLHPMARDRINLKLLITEDRIDGARVSCCVAAEDRSRTKSLIDAEPGPAQRAEIHEPVGLISIFPLRSSLKTLGLALMALANAQIPVHAFCSSLSALTLVIDHDRLQEALAAFECCFDFPGERPPDSNESPPLP